MSFLGALKDWGNKLKQNKFYFTLFTFRQEANQQIQEWNQAKAATMAAVAAATEAVNNEEMETAVNSIKAEPEQ